MALKVDYTSDGDGFTDYVLPKEGARPARLMSIVDVGIQNQQPYKGKVKRPCQQVILGFDLVDDLDDDGNSVRLTTGYFPLNVVTDFKTKQLHEKSKLYAIVKALDPTGKKFKDDFSNLINEACIINVKLVERDGKTYANFDGVGPVPDIEGFKVAETTGVSYIFDMDSPTLETWTALQDRLKAKVREAINYPDSATRTIDETFMEDEASDLPYNE